MVVAMAKGEGNVELLSGMYRVWEDEKNFWRWIVLMIAQQCKYT